MLIMQQLLRLINNDIILLHNIAAAPSGLKNIIHSKYALWTKTSANRSGTLKNQLN